MARFSPDDTAALLLGAWVECSSSFVRRARYDAGSQTLEIEFDNGDVHPYPNVTPTLAEGFAYAPSKGQWLWAVLWKTGRSYSTATSRRRR